MYVCIQLYIVEARFVLVLFQSNFGPFLILFGSILSLSISFGSITILFSSFTILFSSFRCFIGPVNLCGGGGGGGRVDRFFKNIQGHCHPGFFFKIKYLLSIRTSLAIQLKHLL